MAHPIEGGFLTFPGNRLHGVLPEAPATSHTSTAHTDVHGDAEGSVDATEEEDEETPPHRVTLMIGFWTRAVGETGPRRPLGPCAPLPTPTTSCTWPSLLNIPPGLSQTHSSSCEQKHVGIVEPRAVREVSPAWEFIPPRETMGVTGPRYELPQDRDQHFFVHSMSDFKTQLLEKTERAGQ